jgi:CHAD domain-containing protein
MSDCIDPKAPLTSEFRRIATLEIEAALRHLSMTGDGIDEALHECRKRLKSLRALLRLVRSGDEPFAHAENARYREAAALLAGPREAAALLETLDRIAGEFPGKTADGALDTIRQSLISRHREALGRDVAQAVEAAAGACRAGLGRVGQLTLPNDPEQAADILADGVRKTMRRARRALEKAKSRGAADDFHELRKAIKVYSRQLSLLKSHWPSPVKAQRKSLEALAEGLGELHDVFVLRGLLADEAAPLGGPAEVGLLDRLARRSERRLRKICLTAASDVLHAGAKVTARKVARKARRSWAESEMRTAHGRETDGR